MALQSDAQGFLVGEPIEREALIDVLSETRDEIRGLRRDLGDRGRKTSTGANTTHPSPESASDQSQPMLARKTRSAEQSAPTAQASPLSPSRQTDSARQQPRDARGRFVAQPTRGASHSAPSTSRPEPPGAARSAGFKRDSAAPASTTATPIVASRTSHSDATPEASDGSYRDANGRLRDANGRFISSQSGRNAGGRQEGSSGAAESGVLGQSRSGGGESGSLTDALEGLNQRLRGGVAGLNEAGQGSDPAVDAANEVAQPLARGFQAIFGAGERKQNKWFARFWGLMRTDQREERAEEKRQRKILKNIENKPTGGEQGSGLWRLLLLMIGPLMGLGGLLTGLLSAVVGLPLLISGAVLKGLGALLSALGLKSLGGRLAGAGSRVGRPPVSTQSGRPPSTRTPSTAAPRRPTGPFSRAPDARGQGPRAPTPATPSPTPSSGSNAGRGRIGGALRSGARKIPGIGSLLTLGFMGHDIAASEGSDATREEKDRMTGGAVGGGVGTLAGMAAGGAAGATIGSIVPVVGTTIGGIVGSLAGAYFAGSAGEKVGEHVGGWVSDLRGSETMAQIAEAWQWSADFTSALFEGIGGWMQSGWDNLTTTVGAAWEGVTGRVSAQWDALSSAVGARWDSAISAISEQWSALKTAAAERWDSLTQSISDGWDTFTRNFGEAASSLNSWIEEKTGVDVAGSAQAGWEATKNAAGAAAGAVADGASAANDWVADKTGVNIAESTAAVATRVSETAKDVVNSTTTRVSETATAVVEKTREVAESAVETASSAMTTVSDTAHELADKAIQRATDAATDAAESAKKAADKALEATSDAATKVWGALKSWGESAAGAVGGAIDDARSSADAKAAAREKSSGGYQHSGDNGDWSLGQTSEQYESGGRGAGTVSTGKGDHGGVSYGTYQMSSKQGVVQKFLKENPQYGEQFQGLKAGTPAFDQRWKEIAAQDPQFGQDQHQYIKQTHYDPQMQRLQKAGINLSDRGKAVQDSVWSTSVQFGGNTSLIEKALGGSAEGKSDADIIKAVQDYKIRNNESLFRSSSKNQRAGTLRRAHSEREKLLALNAAPESSAPADQADKLATIAMTDTVQASSGGGEQQRDNVAVALDPQEQASMDQMLKQAASQGETITRKVGADAGTPTAPSPINAALDPQEQASMDQMLKQAASQGETITRKVGAATGPSLAEAGGGPPAFLKNLLSQVGGPQLGAMVPAMRAPTPISTPKADADISAAPEISVPLSSTTRDSSQQDRSSQSGDVTRDLSDRRLAHIVTGSYSHAGA